MGATLVGYAIEWWDGHTVRLPAVGGSDAEGVSFTSFAEAEPRLARFAVSMFESFPKGQTRISVPVVLIPRPDNEYDQDAGSVAAPRSMGAIRTLATSDFSTADTLSGSETMPFPGSLSYRTARSIAL
jgi:hypothetical protein